MLEVMNIIKIKIKLNLHKYEHHTLLHKKLNIYI